MQTTDVGPLFFATARFETNLDRLPLLGTLPAQQTDPPYRRGAAVFLRIPLTKFGGFVGLWGRPVTDPDSALMEAIAGEGFALDDEIDEEDKRTVRTLVADHAQNWDDEWTILNVLGLDQ